MKRKNYHLRKDQLEQINQFADRTGLKKSEIVRQAIDLYFEVVPAPDPETEKAQIDEARRRLDAFNNGHVTPVSLTEAIPGFWDRLEQQRRRSAE